MAPFIPALFLFFFLQMYQHDGHGKTIYLSESADATCYGVYSAYEGSRVMKLHIGMHRSGNTFVPRSV